MGLFTEAILREIELRRDYLQEPINTLYLGGGTPSLLPIATIETITNALAKNFHFANNLEFTIEANPDDIQFEQVKYWRHLGINRLSMGIQSFQESALKWMNRAHSVNQSHEAIECTIKAGINNLSVDLIFGTPHLTDAHLLADLAIIKSYSIPHVSCYALTVEEKTALHSFIQKGKLENVNSEDQARQFDIVVSELGKMGMEHYEISNFALAGYRSQHNSSYWNGISYLGLGPSAHSFNGHSRQWNIANNALYFQSLKNNELPFEIEHLDTDTKYNEYMMVSLRRIEGINLAFIETNFGKNYANECIVIAEKAGLKGQLLKTADGYTIAPQVRFLADGIAADFFKLKEN